MRNTVQLMVKTPDQGQAELVIGRGGARKGAGRKPKGLENRKVSLSLSASEWESIDNVQESAGKTRSDVVAELIRLGMAAKMAEK